MYKRQGRFECDYLSTFNPLIQRLILKLIKETPFDRGILSMKVNETNLPQEIVCVTSFFEVQPKWPLYLVESWYSSACLLSGPET